MVKYYTRACNFYFGNQAIKLIHQKRALPLCGNMQIAFGNLELIQMKNKRIKKKTIDIKDIKKLRILEQKIIKRNLKKITSKKRNFLKGVNFSKPSVMGILNLTPDSFSDGGKFNKKNKSFKQISNMIKSGATIIDVGGESTRPGSKTIKPSIEWKRIEFVIKNFKKKYKSTCLSIDTRKSDIMTKSLKYGVNLINDVSAFTFDQNSNKFLKKYNVPKVLHHMQGSPNNMQKNPNYKNVLLDIYDFFEKNINKIKDKNIILDPGIGFGKNLKHNLTLISNISLFHSLGFPILVGTSRKRFIGQVSGKHDSVSRIGGTLASVLFLLSQGVQIFRVHDVKEIKQGILVFDKILQNK